MELFDFIKKNTDQQSVFIFRKPRALSLYTGRSATVYHEVKPENDVQIWEYFNSINVTHIVESIHDSDDFKSFMTRYDGRLEKLFDNKEFMLFKVSYRSPLNGRKGESTLPERSVMSTYNLK